MTNNKHYQMVDDSIVFFDHDTETAAEEIGARLHEIFKGVRFLNTSTGECEAADNVIFGPYISEHTGSFFLVVKANLKMDVPVDLEVKFAEGDTTLHYIDGKFVHVKEYPFFSGGEAMLRCCCLEKQRDPLPSTNTSSRTFSY